MLVLGGMLDHVVSFRLLVVSCRKKHWRRTAAAAAGQLLGFEISCPAVFFPRPMASGAGMLLDHVPMPHARALWIRWKWHRCT